MTDWHAFYNEVMTTVDSLGGDLLFFRGQSDASWSLRPSLARVASQHNGEAERIAYYDFVSRAGSLVHKGDKSWNHLFIMQHHGLPTRVLDWTETFGVALYFALKDATTDAAVWVLDPFALNLESYKDHSLLRPKHLNHNYETYFIDETESPEFSVVALAPLRHNQRMHRQRAVSTLHADLSKPLEHIHPDAIRKLVVPRAIHDDAEKFLSLAGITESTLFPDLDGLARELNKEIFLGFDRHAIK